MLPVSLCVVVAALAGAPAVSIPPPAGLEQKLVDDAKDGKLDSMGLLEAALVASGVPDGDVAAEATRARAALAPAIAEARAQSDPHRRGDVLLQAMHRTVLRNYAITASEIDDVARTGEYNCLSSALLYVVAADGLLDAPTAMVTKHHAFARVKVNGKSVDVETTSPNGFDADRKKLMTPAYVKKIAGPDTSPAELLEDLEHPEELPVLSLVAGVYSNRAVGLVHRGDLQGAAVALDRASHLASGQLRARAAGWRGGVLNSGAIALVDQGRLADAQGLLDLALDGTEGKTRALLTENLATVHLKRASVALDAKDWTGALAHVDAARHLGIAKDDKDAGSLAARADSALAAIEGSDARCQKTAQASAAAECFAGLARSVRDTDLDRALQYSRRAFALDAHSPNSEGTLVTVLSSKANREVEQGKCDDVEALAHEAADHKKILAGQKWTPESAMGACWARAGDRAFDKKDWAEASRLYARARIHLPKDDAIRGNLARVDVNRAIEVAAHGECDQARALAHQAERADKSLSDKSAQLLESCAAVRAKKAADAHDWVNAATELRRGLLDSPSSAVLKENLGTILHNEAAELLKRKDCEGARALLPELESLKRVEARDAVKRQCG